MSGDLQKDIKLNTIEEAIADIRQGKIVIVVDDEDRENEGDFICAAQTITPEIINFMATHGRGLICTPIEEKRAKELNLNMMVNNNTAFHETAFTVSIDLLTRGCTTGISAYDRATGIKALTDHAITAEDYARPGHIFPLIAKNGGVLRRTGHTEAAVDLARLAGYYPAGVLVEILNADGTMARLPQLLEISDRFKLKIITIKDLVAYRMRTESIVHKEKITEIDSEFGKMEIHPYQDITSTDIHYAIKMGTWDPQQTVLVRVQTINSYVDLLQQFLNPENNDFNKSLKAISAEGAGLFLVMKQNDHLLDGIKELKHLDLIFGNGKSNIDERPMGQRDFGVGAQIIRDMGVKKIKLITHTPMRRIALEGYGLEIVDNEVI